MSASEEHAQVDLLLEREALRGPIEDAARLMPGSLTRQEAVELLRDNPSGADLTQALAERFGIGDDDLLRSFEYTIREDVLDAAHRARQALADHPRGAVAKAVREDIALVIGALLDE